MAGLFRRFRRAKTQDLEPEPENVDDAAPGDEVAAEVAPEIEAPDLATSEEGSAESPGFETELTPAPEPMETSSAPDPTQPPVVAPSIEAEPLPSPPAPPVPAAPPSGISPTVPPLAAPKRVEPPLPRPDALDPANAVPPGTRANCFLCGTPLEGGGRCPSCQMSWVE